MIKTFLLLILFSIISCSKPKVVLICGDHICVNKDEAEQYFEENLSLEVKILKNEKKDQINLVELNLKNENTSKKEVILINKKKPNKELRSLSDEEIKKIKTKVKKKANKNNIEKKHAKKINTDKNIDINSRKRENDNLFKKKKKHDVVDVCSIVEKCNIEEISKYLIKQGKKKKFPDITIRQ